MNKLYAPLIATCCLSLAIACTGQEEDSEGDKPASDTGGTSMPAPANSRSEPAGTATSTNTAATVSSASTSTVTDVTTDINPCDPSTGFLARGATEIELGKTYNNPFYSLAVDPLDANRIFVGSESNGVFRSEDGGATWLWLRHGLKCVAEGEYHTYPEVYDIAIDPQDTQKVYLATTGGPGYTLGEVAGLYSSIDGGLHWQQHQFEGLGGDGLVTVAVHPSLAGRIILGMASGIGSRSDIAGQYFPGYLLASSDYGATVESVAQTITNTSGCGFNDAIFRGEARAYASCAPRTSGEAGGFFRSIDGGLTWNVAAALDITRFHAGYSNPDLIYAALRSDSTLQKSTDGGASFVDVMATFEGSPRAVSFAGGPVTISPHSDNVIFLGSGDLVLRSTDGMATMPTTVLTIVDDTLHGSVNIVQDIIVSPSDPDIVYVSARNLRIYKSTDGGATFGSAISLLEFMASQP